MNILYTLVCSFVECGSLKQVNILYTFVCSFVECGSLKQVNILYTFVCSFAECGSLKQVNGGAGYGGGSGGRLALHYNRTFFNGEFKSVGGEGVVKEGGAAGTVFLKDLHNTNSKTLKVYNRKMTGVSAILNLDIFYHYLNQYFSLFL